MKIPFTRSGELDKEERQFQRESEARMRPVLEMLAEKASVPKDARTEFGSTGTLFFQGIIAGEEYNPDLQGEKAIPVYDRMWRSDGQIGAVIRVCELPLLEAEWTVEPATDSAQDKEVAQFVSDNLFSGMRYTWRETLEHILSFYRYGFSLGEKVYALGDDRKLRLKKIAPRAARTIIRFFPGEDDVLESVVQRVQRIDKSRQTTFFQDVEIPGHKLVTFTLKREGANYMGVSLLRQAYKHWWYKDEDYRLDALANERFALGVPVFHEPENPSQEDRDAAARAAMSLMAHEKNYMLVPFGWDFEIVSSAGGKDVMPSVEHHDLMIARAVLAQFINLDQGGSYALSRDGSSLFLQSLQAVGKVICETMNRDVIRELVDYNFKVERYPTLVVSRFDKRNIEDQLAALPALVGVGLITPDPETENSIRAVVGLQDKNPESVNTEQPGTAASDPNDVDSDSQGKEAEDVDDIDKANLSAPPYPIMGYTPITLELFNKLEVDTEFICEVDLDQLSVQPIYSGTTLGIIRNGRVNLSRGTHFIVRGIKNTYVYAESI